jgi:hypothetical protein
MGGTGSENKRARFGGSYWTRRYCLPADFKNVPQYVSGNNCIGVRDLDTAQLGPRPKILIIECCEQDHASQYIWICQLGDDDLRVAV